MSAALGHGVTIRPAEERDVPALLRLIGALAENQNEKQYLTTTEEKLRESGFGDKPKWRALLLEKRSSAIGYATYSYGYHIWSAAKRINIDDLYVDKAFRGLGLGEMLMRRLSEEARNIDADLSWTVQPQNDRAIRFYQRLGAKVAIIGKCNWRT